MILEHSIHLNKHITKLHNYRFQYKTDNNLLLNVSSIVSYIAFIVPLLDILASPTSWLLFKSLNIDLL